MSSIWIFTLLAWERRQAIVYPVEFRTTYEWRQTVKGICAVVLFASSYAFFDTWNSGIVHREITVRAMGNYTFSFDLCPVVPRSVYQAGVTILFQYVLPFLLIAYFYLQIAIKLCYLNDEANSAIDLQNDTLVGLVNQRKRLLYTVLVLVVIFAVCNVPLMYHTFRHAQESSVLNLSLVFSYVANNLSYFNSTINPLVVYSMSTSLRSYLCVLPRDSRDRSFHTSSGNRSRANTNSNNNNPTNVCAQTTAA